MGRAARLSLPSPLLKAAVWGFVRIQQVQIEDANIPAGGFSTFGDFFTRTLKPGLRPVDETPGALVSPCDGRVRTAGQLENEGRTRFEVKGRSYGVDELMGREGWWSGLQTGGYAIIYLSPADYHRVHSPVDGSVRSVWHLDGTTLPVNDLGQVVAPWSIVRNERVVFDFQGSEGRTALVMVGALAVRAIEVTVPGFMLDRPAQGEPTPVRRADEVGIFHLGSTVVVLWDGSSEVNLRPNQRVRFGQRLAVR